MSVYDDIIKNIKEKFHHDETIKLREEERVAAEEQKNEWLRERQ